jgi:chemotaxis signal transduction protein
VTTHPPAAAHHSGTAEDATAALRRVVAGRAGRVDLLVLHVGDERFAVPLAASAEVVRLAGVAAVESGELPHRGGRVPLLDAAGTLGVPGGAPERGVAAVVRGAGETFALAVDAAVPAHGVDLAGVRPVPWPDEGVLLGVLPRGDTVVALIDADALAALVAPRPEASSLAPAPLQPGQP